MNGMNGMNQWKEGINGINQGRNSKESMGAKGIYFAQKRAKYIRENLKCL